MLNISSYLSENSLAGLRSLMSDTWNILLSNSTSVAAIKEGAIDIRFYLIYLIETYHYTFHNSRNQALVGVREDNENIQYMRYAFEHAMEETGHENMAYHDLKSLGILLNKSELPGPLPATEILIAYLYRVSLVGHPLSRLGYSFWSENSYDYIMTIINLLKEKLGLERKNLTFFIQHSELDDGHAEKVEKTIAQHAKTSNDWQAISRVMVTSLQLAVNMLDNIYQEFCRLDQGQPSSYSVLNQFNNG